ncbi:MAG: MATE family efflux transporter [Proteobacteria bacterium]|nr:MATE family efflux transporter [Pseudomonadota bacterium]
MRDVLVLSWPIMISMLSFTAMIVVDSIYVAQLGTAPLAAMGLATAVTFLLISFGMGLLRATKVVVAQRSGAGDHGAVERSVIQAVVMAVGLGLVGACFAPFGDLMFSVMGGSAEVNEHADAYYTVRVLGLPFAFTLIALKAWFEGRGDTRTPMVATLFTNGLNIGLDPVFIFGWGFIPAMGTGGAALATVLACLGGLAFAAWRTRLALANSVVRWRIELPLAKEMLRIGFPMGFGRLIDVGAWLVFVSMLARLGDAELAAHVIVMRIVSVSFLPGYAIGEASGVFVGMGIGAGKPEITRQAFKAGVLCATVLMTAMSVIFVLFPGPFIGLFGASAEVVEVATMLMVVAAAFQLVDAPATVGICALNGAGDTRFVMVATSLAVWLGNLPLAYTLAMVVGWGAVGAWIGLTVEITLIALMMLWRIQGSTWLSKGLKPLDVTANDPVSEGEVVAA